MGDLETPAEKEGDGGVQPKMEARMSRKEKRKTMKKMKRKQTRKEIALKQQEEEEARLQDPQELINMEQEEAKRSESVRIIFEERERAWIEAMEIRKKKRIEEEERRISALEYEELSRKQQIKNANDDGDDDWEYVEEGPAEIIWQENEITVKKKRVKVPKRNKDQRSIKEDSDRPTSNPLPPQSEAFDDYKMLLYQRSSC
ncbi:putative U2 auxiliary factor small subunit [Rosa chinensis]|uniref:Putative U2 auxiliary factor small subunit n=1 Tax=Rosa chinensis TaxID=74649 RepID=A0A2P6PD10_ROSCH|nr:putative U2 auxiliary factor small subunit [Rosa chinensis]